MVFAFISQRSCFFNHGVFAATILSNVVKRKLLNIHRSLGSIRGDYATIKGYFIFFSRFCGLSLNLLDCGRKNKPPQREKEGNIFKKYQCATPKKSQKRPSVLESVFFSSVEAQLVTFLLLWWNYGVLVTNEVVCRSRTRAL